MAEDQKNNVDRGRMVDDYKHSIIQSIEHDEMQHGNSVVMREQYDERTRQLDENESVCKAQYDNNHCEEVTGLSSDGYRHQVIEDCTHEQRVKTSATESQEDDYRNESEKSHGAGSFSAMESARDEQFDYWVDNSFGNSATDQNLNEQENKKSNEASF